MAEVDLAVDVDDLSARVSSLAVVDDNTAETVRLPVEMWNLGPRFLYRFPARKRVRRVEVDPRHVLPDQDRSNNTWERR